MAGDIREEIEKLRAELHQDNYNYYVLDNPTISDFEFDQKLKHLQDLEKAHPEFNDPNSPTQRVGGSVIKDFPTITHQYRMYSLDNSYDFNDLVDWKDRVEKALGRQDVEYVVELKYDGASISLLYEDGKLVRAVTRGDGFQGDEVTNNIRTIPSIPLKLHGDYPKRFFIRGEILMPITSFNRLNEEREQEGLPPYMNPRNTASGSLKLQDSSEVKKRGLDAVLYQFLADEYPAPTHWELLDKARTWGFKVSEGNAKVCHSIEEAKEFIDHWDKKRFDLNFATDGMVIKVNSITEQQELGYTAKSPRWGMAYKFKAQKVKTLLESVSFQVGRTGTITPVANLKPALLAGTVVKRASLHNEGIIKKLDLHDGDYVYVEKGGEIIPKIVGVDLEKRKPNAKPIEFIKNCPECGTRLVREEDQAANYCPNSLHCPPQVVGRIIHFVSRKALDIENLGSETIEQLYREGLIKDPSDLYTLTKAQLLPMDRMAEKSAQNILDGIGKSKTIPYEKVLYGLGIQLVGETVAKKIAKTYPSIDALKAATAEELTQMNDIGSKIAESIVSFLNDDGDWKMIERLKSFGVQLQRDTTKATTESDILEGKTFLFTGKLSLFTREEAQEMVEQNGGRNLAAVSKNLNYLVVGENAGSKLKKAEALGTVGILDEQEFLDLLKD